MIRSLPRRARAARDAAAHRAQARPFLGLGRPVARRQPIRRAPERHHRPIALGFRTSRAPGSRGDFGAAHGQTASGHRTGERRASPRRRRADAQARSDGAAAHVEDVARNLPGFPEKSGGQRRQARAGQGDASAGRRRSSRAGRSRCPGPGRRATADAARSDSAAAAAAATASSASARQRDGRPGARLAQGRGGQRGRYPATARRREPKLRKEPGSKPAAASPEGEKLINELKERQALREQRMAARASGAQER